ncbi:MAG TPA: Zn-dependent hydrolase [Novosphingobium sp.]|nr:Zn-dependent hydrolase [Novosphingobium sp.]
MMPEPDINRAWARIEALAAMTRPDMPWTRRAFSPLFDQSRSWLRAEFEKAGLETHVDAAGNLIGTRPGKVAGARPLITGSHCDTVVGGGRFDGILGVLAGIEVAATLHDHGVELDHPFQVIDFLSEEPSDYGISCVGSRGFAGTLTAPMLASTNEEGETLAQAMRRIGADPDALAVPLNGPGSVAAFVELHIEQGPVLENTGIPIGIVTGIVGIRRQRIVVNGQADHAGTTPMDIRHDALAGAARIVTAVNELASRMSGAPHYVVATIGRILMTPNVPNAVPAQVEMVLEMRSDAEEVLAGFSDLALGSVGEALADLRVSVEVSELSRSQPVACTPAIADVIEAAAGKLGYPTMRLPSGAGHDAAYVAASGLMGMLFVPCLGGRSHCPEEWIEPQQMLDGIRVLQQTLLMLDDTLEV